MELAAGGKLEARAEVLDERGVGRLDVAKEADAETDEEPVGTVFDCDKKAMLVAAASSEVCCTVPGFALFPVGSMAAEGLGVLCCSSAVEDGSIEMDVLMTGTVVLTACVWVN